MSEKAVTMLILIITAPMIAACSTPSVTDRRVAEAATSAARSAPVLAQ